MSNMPAEDESCIVKPREFAEIIKAPTADLVADFLEQPLMVSIESMTGFLASGPKEWTLAIGRIVQAPLKAKLFDRLHRRLVTFARREKYLTTLLSKSTALKLGPSFSQS